MKKMILATAAVAAFGLSAGASAVDCAIGGLCSVPSSTTNYISSAFDLQLSSGVTLRYVQSTTAVGVGTFHGKGNTGFAGISNGGQIIPCGSTAVIPTVVSSNSGATGC